MDMKQFFSPKTVVGALVSALMVGIVSSGLWDLLFRPGVTHAGRVALSLVTLGSETIRDQAYASAALDPTPIPALLLFFIVALAPVVIGSLWLGALHGRRSAEKSSKLIDEESGGDPRVAIDLIRDRIARLQRIAKAIGATYLIALSCVTLISYAVVNQSVAIWRIYHANLAICSPYLSDLEHKRLRARFASVKTKHDFTSIADELRSVAQQNGAKLIDFDTW